MMKWLSLIFSIILCFLSLQAIGQSELPDEVHLKNGSIFRGKIINYAPGENLSIKIANEQIIVLKEDEVEKILQSNMVIVESGKPIINFRKVVFDRIGIPSCDRDDSNWPNVILPFVR